MRAARSRDVAVIGTACRFPGASTPDLFWRNLVDGVESIAVFSDQELLAAGTDPELLRHPHYVKAAPILDNHDRFDAAFFGYSPREARLMDPQHRLFLEVAWEAFEAAGYDPLGDNGAVGVYAGAGGLVSSYVVQQDHPELRGQTGDLGHIGNDRDFLPSRVAFKLNLTGPSINVQTACSTSLVAIHLACQALLDGEADMALAGASVVRVPQIRGYLAEPGGIYSVDGHCRAFDANASGTLFGSGVAAVLLRPLGAAIEARDNIYAVIKGTAVTNDGAHKVNYTASTASAQARAMTQALARCEVEPDSIGYVECHGTGTALGDPIELQALTRAFRRQTKRVGFCPIGSVKSNFGHLEQCAGIAGLIKAVLALHHGLIPPSLHFTTPNPRIPFDRSPFFVNTRLRQFDHSTTPRRAAVNSVGMGGTNAFAVLEQAPGERRREAGEPQLLALALSAKSQSALAAQLANFRAALAAPDAPELDDLCLTANRGRHHFEHRSYAVGTSREEILKVLERPSVSDPCSGRHMKPQHEAIAFLFSGQGAQYPRMGEALYRAEPVFRRALDGCFALFEASGIALSAVLFDDDEVRLTRTLYAQPALFSLQIALTDLWAEWGILPDAVIGHSVGEFAAAVVAGVLVLEEAARLVAARAQLMEALPQHGIMASIGASLDNVRALWPAPCCDIAIAAENAPDRIVVSGSAVALAPLLDQCRRRGMPVSELKTSHAFHSPLMDPILEDFTKCASSTHFKPPQLRWISTVTGEEMVEAADTRYWRDQIRQQVRFRQAIEAAADSVGMFLEIGPGSTLISLGRRSIPLGDKAWLCSMAGQDEQRSLLEAFGAFYLRGRRVNWAAVAPRGARRVALPTYPFQDERFWLEASRPERIAVEDRPPRHAEQRRDQFLGERLGGDNFCFEALLSLDRFAFLRDHRVFQQPVLPSVVILGAVMAAAPHLGFSHPVVADFVYELALTLPEDEPLWTQLSFEPAVGVAPFRFESTGMDPNDHWRLHASGILRDGDTAPVLPPLPSNAPRYGHEIPPARFYKSLDECGLSYRSAFRGVTELWRDGDQVFATIALPAGIEGEAGGLHPAFVDACLHVYAALAHDPAIFAHEDSAEPEIYVPIGIDAFHLYRPAASRACVHGLALQRRGDGPAEIKLDIRVYGEDRQQIALFQGLTVRRTGRGTAARAGRSSWQQLLYGVDWREIPDADASRGPTKYWYILSDAAGVGGRLAEALDAIGCFSIVVSLETALTEELLATASAAAPPGIVDLRALDASSADPAPLAMEVCGGCLDLIKLLDRVRHRLPHPPRLWLVTAGAQRGDDSGPPIDAAQSSLWGLGRTFALEYPEMWGGLIDLQPGAAPETMVDCLMCELMFEGGEDQVAFRDGKRLAPRFVPLRLADLPKDTLLSPDATYWIIGGLGRLGSKVAEALVGAGACHLVLTGRSPAAQDTAGTFEKLQRDGEVVIHPSDIACAADVADVLALIRKSMPPLKGVIHAAAVFEDAVLANATSGTFERVMRPKVCGAWNLHNATRELPLDFFILFSSVLSLWGAAGQGAYAAANGFLDGLAAHRRGRGLPATVINWGPWDDAVTIARWGQAGGALWRQRATAPVPAPTCLEILASLLGNGPVQVAVTDTRWPDFITQFQKPPSLFCELAPPVARTVASARSEMPSSIAETVAWHAAQILGLDGRIDTEQPLNELGLDSLLAVALANRLRQALDISVPTALLLKGPSVRDLVRSLFPGLADSPGGPAPGKASTARVEGGGWLVTHRSNPEARIRLIGFPFAGGGAATFRMWSEHLDPSIELIAIEPPGRQTRIDEPPIREIGEFLRQLLPALLPALDKPFAVYGHCLGALTLFETVRTLISKHRIAPLHVFVSGARTPDELHAQQAFEMDLMERLLQLPDYNVFEPIHRQPDEVFSEAIRRFNVLATEDFLGDRELRRLILPAIRAEFEMSTNYRYVPGPPWDVPITCLTGAHDSYVSANNARAWGRFTSKNFQLFMLDSEHFIVVEDNEFVLRVINRELTSPF